MRPVEGAGATFPNGNSAFAPDESLVFDFIDDMRDYARIFSESPKSLALGYVLRSFAEDFDLAAYQSTDFLLPDKNRVDLLINELRIFAILFAGGKGEQVGVFFNLLADKARKVFYPSAKREAAP